MKDDMKIAQALGLLDGTLGSPRDYSASDYKRRIEMAASLLRGEKYPAKTIAEDMQRQAFLDAPPERTRVERVREAFDTLYKIYGFQGESGTEELLYRIAEATDYSIKEVDRSHDEDGLCTDCVSLMAGELDEAVERAKKDTPVEQSKALAYV